jgi:hypothetical protein
MRNSKPLRLSQRRSHLTGCCAIAAKQNPPCGGPSAQISTIDKNVPLLPSSVKGFKNKILPTLSDDVIA